LGVKALRQVHAGAENSIPGRLYALAGVEPAARPIHKASVEKHGKDWTKPGNMVNNGAYTMTTWDVNAKIVLAKSPSYWDAKNVQITKFTYLAVEDGNADVKLFESGENDMVYQLPPGTYDKVQGAIPQRDSQLADAGPALLLVPQHRPAAQGHQGAQGLVDGD
jgi:oligopeptide transport system substrate-binding protein